MWLTRYPRHLAGQELRVLVLMILKIKSVNDKLYWIKEFKAWHLRHKEYLNQKTYHEATGRYWYTHKFLRRSYQTVNRALPNMFRYVQNPKIPGTTNGIEGFFSHLKNQLDLYRGLNVRNGIDFIKWYVYLSNSK